MDIRFCDLCDASIPESDLARGVARRPGGRWLCAPCRKATSYRRVATGLLLPLAFLAAAASGAAVAVKVMEPRANRLEVEVGDLRTSLAAATAEDPVLTDILATLARTDDELARAVRTLESAQADRGAGIDEALAAIGDRMAAVEDSIAEVREYIAERDARAGSGSGGDEVPQPTPPPTIGVEDWLPHVADADPGVRLSALVALEGAEDPRVAAAARVALGDSDAIVRAQAATMLGDRGDPGAIPGLTDLLTDPNLRVRSVAHRALERIAGVSLPYDAADSEAERQAAAARIREALLH